VSTPAVSNAGHARTFEETSRWLATKLRHVPITRVFDVTPLDYVGVPVWSAVTPLAKDLTVHAGKGESAAAARLSAIMEGIERVCAETIAPDRLRFASYRDLTAAGPPAALDPVDCDLPFGSTYAPDRPISWVAGWDLLGQQEMWVAADLVRTPAVEGVCLGIETNGLAAGNTYTEATVHALYELIERDATAHADFTGLYGGGAEAAEAPAPLIDPATLPGRAAPLVQHLRALGMALQIRDITQDNGIPVFDVRLLDRWFPSGPSEFGGYGASLDPARAVIRGLTEAVQAHTMQMVGSRDTYEPLIPDRRGQRQPGAVWYRAPPARSWPFADQAPSATTDLLTELQVLVQRLRACGCTRCVVVDLEDERLQVPVVRVLVPGLAQSYGQTQRRPALRLLRLFV
jgi:YcaO-like protein with predicted kinase domain